MAEEIKNDFCGNHSVEHEHANIAARRIGELVHQKVESKRLKLKNAKNKRNSPPYMQPSENTRSNEITYIPLFFHVFHDAAYIESELDSGLWPDEQITYMVNLLNDHMAGTITEAKDYVYGPSQRNVSTLTTSYLEGGYNILNFTAPINHPDHGVGSNIRYKIPDKIPIQSLYDSPEFNNTILDSILESMGWDGNTYLTGGDNGVIFRYPKHIWKNSPVLKGVESGGVLHDQEIFQNIPGIHVFLNSPTSNFRFGGVATFPWAKNNFTLNLSGKMHWTPDVAVEVLFHELGHCWGLMHTHQNSKISKLEGGTISNGEVMEVDWVMLNALPGKVTFNPPTYVDPETNIEYADLQPLPPELKEYTEYIFNEIAKFHYSYLPTLRKKIVEHGLNLGDPTNLVNSFLEEFGYSPNFYLYDQIKTKNLSFRGLLLDGKSEYYNLVRTHKSLLDLAYVGVGDVPLGDPIANLFQSIDNFGLPFWGGSQAYDLNLEKNVLVINPSGPSDLEVGNVNQAYTIEQAIVPTIGEELGGGLVFYIDEEEGYCLIISDEDLPLSPMIWGPDYTLGIYGGDIGDGEDNTIDIMNGLAALGYTATTPPALLASTYNHNGYTDWYLPSSGEMQAAAEALGSSSPLGNIATFDEWNAYGTSTENENSNQWTQNTIEIVSTANGAINIGFKSVEMNYRAIRRQDLGVENINARRGPNITMRIPFCKLDANGDMTTEYDPLWAIHFNFLNPIYPAYPENYPVKDWLNLTPAQCPCIDQEQTSADGTFTYMPKEIDSTSLTAIISEEFNAEMGVPCMMPHSLFSGSINPNLATGWAPSYEEGMPFADIEVIPPFLYYGFSPLQANRPRHYDPTLGALILPPTEEHPEGVTISPGYVTGGNYFSDLTIASHTAGADGNIDWGEHLGQASYYMTGSRNPMFIGPFVDYRGNTQTINLQNPLKVHIDLNLNPVDAPNTTLLFNGAGNFGFDPAQPHIDTVRKFTEQDTWDFPYKNAARENCEIGCLGLQFLKPVQEEYNYNHMKHLVLSSANLFHPEGVFAGVNVDGYSKFSYLDLTNSMQYQPAFRMTSYDHLETSLNNIAVTSLLPSEDSPIRQIPADANLLDYEDTDTYMDKHAKYYIQGSVKIGVYDLIMKNYYNIKGLNPVNAHNYLPAGVEYDDIYNLGQLATSIPHAPLFRGKNSKWNKQLKVEDCELNFKYYGGRQRFTYSPDQLFYIESYVEYAKEYIGQNVEVDAGVPYGWAIHANSITHAIERLRNMLAFAEEIGLSDSTVYAAEDQLSIILEGGNLTIRNCDFTTTSYIPTSMNLAESSTVLVVEGSESEENTRLYSPRDGNINTEEVLLQEYTIEGPFFTYGDEMYDGYNNSFAGYYIRHSEYGLQKVIIAAGEFTQFNFVDINTTLKTFAELPKNSTTYKNLLKVPKKFNEIYTAILKNL